MFSKYKLMFLAACSFFASGAMAQDEKWFSKNNVFVTAGVQTEALMNTDGYITAAGKVGAGIWLRPWLGLKLEGVAGNTHLMTDSRGQVFGGQLTYMGQLIKGKDKFNTFGLNATAGVGFYHYNFGSILKNYTYMDMVTGNVGLQMVYNFTPRWSIYLEPSVQIQPKYYDVNHKDKMAPSFLLSAGITYTFASKSKKAKAVKPEYAKVTVEEFKSINNGVNQMRYELNLLKKKVHDADELMKNNKLVIEPMKDVPALSIGFDIMGAVINDSDKEKINDLGLWMQDHTNSINIVPFADYSNDIKETKDIKLRRFMAIKNILVEKFGIDANRIQMSEPEDLGYKNMTKNEALIVFMSK